MLKHFTDKQNLRRIQHRVKQKLEPINDSIIANEFTDEQISVILKNVENYISHIDSDVRDIEFNNKDFYDNLEILKKVVDKLCKNNVLNNVLNLDLRRRAKKIQTMLHKAMEHYVLSKENKNENFESHWFTVSDNYTKIIQEIILINNELNNKKFPNENVQIINSIDNIIFTE